MGFLQIQDTGKLRLFRSYKSEYLDGEQVRDFIYIKDAVSMTLYFLGNREIGGLFNVGSGIPRTWNDLAKALFQSMEKETNIEYVDMPKSIRNQYQYHTCGEITKIKNSGCVISITSLEDGIQDYVKNYLLYKKHL